MKKIMAMLLASMLTVSTLCLASCGKKETSQGEETPDVSVESSVVTVKIVDKVNEKDILEIDVPAEPDATVLGITVTACAGNGVSYELNDDETAFKSLDGLADFAYSDEDDAHQWHYLLNGHDGIDEEDYSPAAKTVKAGDVIQWQYESVAE